MKANEGDMIKEMMQVSDTFMVGLRAFEFNDKDPIFFRNGPAQDQVSKGSCYSCDVPFKTYKLMKYW